MVLRCAVRESLSWFRKRDRDIKLEAELDLLWVVEQDIMQHKQDAENKLRNLAFKRLSTPSKQNEISNVCKSKSKPIVLS